MPQYVVKIGEDRYLIGGTARVRVSSCAVDVATTGTLT
jgi:hypothetical protein